MQVKKKLCDVCNKLSFIWKTSGTGGKKLCKKCSTTGVDMKKPTIKAKPIAPRSQKRSKEERLYSAKRVLFLSEFPMCQANIQGVCKGQATEVHHKKGRIGNDLLDETNWLALCHNCHEYVENNREFAMEKGYSIKRIT